MYSASTMFHSS